MRAFIDATRIAIRERDTDTLMVIAAAAVGILAAGCAILSRLL